MAITQTTLAAAITSSQLSFALTATTGFAANQVIEIDGERMLCQSVPVSGTVTVMLRGYDGTVANPHDILAPVTTGLPSDFPGVPSGAVSDLPPYYDEQLSLGQDGSITIPTRNTIYTLNKGSALALTITAPSLAANGLRLSFTSTTAFAHVITADPSSAEIFVDGTSAGPEEKLTFAAFAGASCVLVAENGLWNTLSGGAGVTAGD
jgi:hypothetical protein